MYVVITKIEQQKRNKNLYSVFVDGIFAFSVEDIDLHYIAIKEGQNITGEQLNQFKIQYEYKSALNRALNFISFKMRTKNEVMNKLKSLEYSDISITMAIKELERLGYLDDQDYTARFFKDYSNKYSRNVIRMKLLQKGVSKDLIEDISKIEEFSEYDAAYEIAKRKLSKVEHIDKNQLHKVYQFLLRKGFSYEVVKKVISELV